MSELVVSGLTVGLSSLVGQAVWIAGLVVAWRVHRQRRSRGSRLGMLAFGLLIVIGVLKGVTTFLAFPVIDSSGASLETADLALTTIRATFNLGYALLVVLLASAFIHLYRAPNSAR